MFEDKTKFTYTLFYALQSRLDKLIESFIYPEHTHLSQRFSSYLFTAVFVTRMSYSAFAPTTPPDLRPTYVCTTYLAAGTTGPSGGSW